MITEKMREFIATQLNTALTSGSGAVGQGGNSTNPSNNVLDVPLLTGISTTVSQTGGVIDVKLTVLGSALNGKTIREVGLFNSTPDMLQRINFDAVGPITNSEILEIFITMEVE